MAETKPCVVLLGAQHVGKTTVGRMLAERCSVPFFDTDEEATRLFGTHPTVLSFEGGRAAYNRAESAVCRLLSARFRSSARLSAVISTGSGFCLNDEGIGILREVGVLVCLDGDLERAAERVVGEAVELPASGGEEARLDTRLLSFGNFANLYSYAVRAKVKSRDDIRRSFLAQFTPRLDLYRAISDVVVPLADGNAEQNADLVYTALAREWWFSDLRANPSA